MTRTSPMLGVKPTLTLNSHSALLGQLRQLLGQLRATHLSNLIFILLLIQMVRSAPRSRQCHTESIIEPYQDVRCLHKSTALMTMCSTVDGCCFGRASPSTDDLHQLWRRGTDKYVVRQFCVDCECKHTPTPVVPFSYAVRTCNSIAQLGQCTRTSFLGRWLTATLLQVLVAYLCCFLLVTTVLGMVAPILKIKLVRLTMGGMKLVLCLHFQRGIVMTTSCVS